MFERIRYRVKDIYKDPLKYLESTITFIVNYKLCPLMFNTKFSVLVRAALIPVINYVTQLIHSGFNILRLAGRISKLDSGKETLPIIIDSKNGNTIEIPPVKGGEISPNILEFLKNSDMTYEVISSEFKHVIRKLLFTSNNIISACIFITPDLLALAV